MSRFQTLSEIWKFRNRTVLGCPITEHVQFSYTNCKTSTWMAHLTMSSITGICEKGLGQLGEEHLQNRGHFVDLRRKIKHLQYNIKSKLEWISDTNCSVFKEIRFKTYFFKISLQSEQNCRDFRHCTKKCLKSVQNSLDFNFEQVWISDVDCTVGWSKNRIRSKSRILNFRNYSQRPKTGRPVFGFL